MGQRLDAKSGKCKPFHICCNPRIRKSGSQFWTIRRLHSLLSRKRIQLSVRKRKLLFWKLAKYTKSILQSSRELDVSSSSDRSIPSGLSSLSSNDWVWNRPRKYGDWWI